MFFRYIFSPIYTYININLKTFFRTPVQGFETKAKGYLSHACWKKQARKKYLEVKLDFAWKNEFKDTKIFKECLCET